MKSKRKKKKKLDTLCLREIEKQEAIASFVSFDLLAPSFAFFFQIFRACRARPPECSRKLKHTKRNRAISKFHRMENAKETSNSRGVIAEASPPSPAPPPPPPPLSHLLPPSINALTPEDHAKFMRRAIALSRSAGLEERTGGCFGAVVVCSKTREILGEGQNRVLETKDPTAHGEVMCLRDACFKLKSPHLPKGTAVLYSSAEPCAMCHAACLWARCSYLFYAASYEDVMELGKFDDVNFAAEIARRVEEKKKEKERREEEREREEEEGEEGEEEEGEEGEEGATGAAVVASLPVSPLIQIAPPLLREEALVVWREYAARSDNEQY